MKSVKHYFLLLILSLFIFSILFSSPVLASHATCTTDGQGANNPYLQENNECDAVIDWSEMFLATDMGGGDTLWDTEYEEERFLFTQISLATNEDVNNRLSQNNFYTYEIHSISNSEQINTGTQENVIYNRNDEYSRTSDGSEHGSHTINNFIPNKVKTDVYIPYETYITIKVYDEDSMLADSVEIHHDDLDYSYVEDEKTRISREITIPQDKQSNKYTVEAELSRDNTETKSPEISEGVLLEREIPPYRTYSMGLSSYPQDMLSSYHLQTYMSNYNDDIHSDVGYYSVLTPSYPEEMYDDYIVRNRHYEGPPENSGNEGRPIRNSYVSIDRIEPSIKVPTGNIGQEWDKIISDEGDIYITYDSAVADAPLDGRSYSDSPSVGDTRWSYSSLQDATYDLSLEAHFEDGTSTNIDRTTRDNSGVWHVDYDENDLNNKEVSHFYSEIEFTIQYTRYNSVYVRYLIERVPDGPDRYGTRWEDDTPATETITMSHTVDDTIDIDRMDYNDGPDNNDFDVSVGLFSDESRTHVNRELGNGLEQTRWTNLESKSIIQNGKREIDINNQDSNNPRTIRIAEQRARSDTDIPQEIFDRLSIDGEITGDMSVHLDVWAHGDFGNGNVLNTYINNENIGSNTINSQSREQRQHIIQNEDIHNQIVGEDKFNLNHSINTDSDNINNNPYITYSLTIGIDEPISRIDSRWKYWTFRDAQWDNIDEILEGCSDGGILAEIRRALSGTCFDLEEKQISPSGAHPMQTHLLPSIDQLGVEFLPQQPGYKIDNVHYSELSNAMISTPIKSEYCPHNLNLDSEERACNVYQGYLADDDIEQSYINDEFEFIGDAEIEGNDDEYDNYLSSLEPADYSFEREYTTSDGDTQILDYRSLVDDVNNYEFREEDGFEIVSQTGITDFQISGNASWTYNDIDTEDIRIATRTGLSANIVSEQELTEEFITNTEPALASDNEIRTNEELVDGQRQMRLRLMDEYNQPIHTEERNTDESIKYTNFYIDSSGDVIEGDEEKSIETNEDGYAYTIVPENTNRDYSHTEFEFKTYDNWWETPSDIRVLEYSDTEIQNQERIKSIDDEQLGDITSALFDTLLAVVLILVFSFFALAMTLRIHPDVNTTTMDMFYTMTDPYRKPILDAIQLFILVCILLLVLRFLTLYLAG